MVLRRENVGRESPTVEVVLGMKREGLEDEALDVLEIVADDGRSVASEDCDMTLRASKQVRDTTKFDEELYVPRCPAEENEKTDTGTHLRSGDAVIN